MRVRRSSSSQHAPNSFTRTCGQEADIDWHRSSLTVHYRRVRQCLESRRAMELLCAFIISQRTCFSIGSFIAGHRRALAVLSSGYPFTARVRSGAEHPGCLLNNHLFGHTAAANTRHAWSKRQYTHSNESSYLDRLRLPNRDELCLPLDISFFR
jgi:hypothetical protein